MRRLFGTDGVRGIVNEYPMTLEVCQKIAEAIFVKFCFCDNKQVIPLVLIGHDPRSSADMFECAMSAVFFARGVNVLQAGVVSTPHLAMLTRSLLANVGIMISASHNPGQYNGIKLFTCGGAKLTDKEEVDLEKIIGESYARSPVRNEGPVGRYSSLSLHHSEYYEKIENVFRINMEQARATKVVVDCANGSVSYYVLRTLSEAYGFDILCINNQPNGTNINENCGVTHPQIICDAVLEYQADVGLSFDGDGDRILISDENGKILDGDHILALLAMSESCKEVVSTIMANTALEQYLSFQGIRLVRTAVGDRHVSDYMQKNNLEFGAEPSGHVIIASHLMSGDGLFAGLKILEIMLRSRKKSSELRLFESYPTIRRDLPIRDKSVVEEPGVRRRIQELQKQLEGKGKLIVRPSGTEPMIRIMAEGNDVAELQRAVDDLSQILTDNQ
ncbi:MAG: hypothetical protein LBS14_01035 [Holosporaceae bacterium]|jgi:phosphoglucosamine mutase|nr:hypothetical protein [Holosporaceae bacterium]